MTGFMGFPFVEVLEIGGWCRDCTHAARRLTRFSGPGHYCSANHPKWSGWGESHSRPPPSEGGRLLLTLHPVFKFRVKSAQWKVSALQILHSSLCILHLKWLPGLDS